MDIKTLITPPKVIAVVGLSDKPERPSFEVGSYLKSHGFTVIPINPMITETLGLPTFPSLASIPKGVTVDIVDIFRRSEEVPAIIDEVVTLGWHPMIWMQENVISEEAKKKAEAAGFPVVMNQCLMKSHRAMFHNET